MYYKSSLKCVMVILLVISLVIPSTIIFADDPPIEYFEENVGEAAYVRAAVVHNTSQLKEALISADVRRIYFGADITLTGAISVSPAKKDLIIDGRNPRGPDPEKIHRFTDVDRNEITAGMYLASKGMLEDITFRSIDLQIRNYYGVIYTPDIVSNVTYTFEDTVFTGRQMLYNRYGSIVFTGKNDLTMTTSSSSMPAEVNEVAEVRNVTIGGELKIISEASIHAIFWLSSGGDVRILDDAVVDINNIPAANLAGIRNYGFLIPEGASNIYIGNGANFSYLGYSHFVNYPERLTSVLVGEHTNVNIEIKGNLYRSIMRPNLFQIGKGANLRLIAPDNAEPTFVPLAVESASGLKFESPASVVLYNKGGRAMGTAANTPTYAFENIKTLAFYDKSTSSVTDWNAYIENESNRKYTWQNPSNAPYSVSYRMGSGNGVSSISTQGYSGSTPFTTSSLSAAGVRGVVIYGNYSPPPKLSDIVEGDKFITGEGVGTAAEDSTIKVYDEDNALIETTSTAEDGTWSIAVPSGMYLREGQVIKATQSITGRDGQYNAESDPDETTVKAKMFALVGNTQDKLYIPHGGIADHLDYISKADRLISVNYVILPNPYDTRDVEALEDLGEPIHPVDLRDSIIEIPYNCKIWAEAVIEISGREFKVLESISYNNVYITEPLMLRGIDVANNRYLYGGDNTYDIMQETQGIPYDGNGDIIENPRHGYDSMVLKRKDIYARHWTAEVGEGQYAITLNAQTPVHPITLDPDPSDSENICDAGDLFRYTLKYSKINAYWWENIPVKFVDGSGTSVEVDSRSDDLLTVPRDIDAISNPLSSSNNFLEYGGYYIPPKEADKTPIAFKVVEGNDFDDGNEPEACLNFAENFDPKFDDVDSKNYTVFIIYDTAALQVTERFAIYTPDQPHQVQRENIVAHDPNTDYIRMGESLKMEGYVLTGYETTITGFERYLIDIDDFRSDGSIDGNSSQADLLQLEIDKNVLNDASERTVTFLFSPDSNRNGIPDSEEARVNVRYQGYYPGESNTMVISSESWDFISRIEKDVTVANDRADGDENHKIPTGAGVSAWLFNKIYADAAQTYAPDSVNGFVHFYYDYSSDGITADKDQYVTERYFLYGSDYGDDTEALQPAMTAYVLNGEKYTSRVSKITKDGITYLPMAYYLDDHKDQIQEAYTNGEAFPQVTFPAAAGDQSVTFLYRPEGAAATVRWVGKTYTGIEIDLGAKIYGGYIGEEVSVSLKELEYDERWFFQEAASQLPTALQDEHIKLTLGTEVQNYYFYFEERLESSQIDIRYVSDDNQIDFTIPLLKQVSDSKFALKPYSAFGALSGYEILDCTLTLEYQNSVTVDWETEEIDPSNGNQVITFHLVPTTALIVVKGYDQTDNLILRQGITDAKIGESYSVHAPHIPDYVLQDQVDGEDQVLIQTIEVAAGTNDVKFYYQEYMPAEETVLLRLVEQDPDKPAEQYPIIQAYLMTYNEGETIEIPDLSGSFYIPVTQDSERAVFEKGMEPVTYVYEKDMLDVIVEAKCGDTVLDTREYSDGARKGEMYQATAFTVQGHTLAEGYLKRVYADPASLNGVLRVTFEYTKDQFGQVEVIYQCQYENGTTEILGSFPSQVTAGEKFTASWIDFSDLGFEFDETEENKFKEITVSEAGDRITFDYKDVRSIITIKTYKDDVYEGTMDMEERAVKGKPYFVPPASLYDYVLKAYQIDTSSKVDIDEDVTLIPVNADENRTLHLYYESLGTVIKDGYATASLISYEDLNENGKYDTGEEITRQEVKDLLAGDAYTPVQPDLSAQGYQFVEADTENPAKLEQGENRYYFRYEKVLSSWSEVQVIAVYEDGSAISEEYYTKPESVLVLTGDTYQASAPFVISHALLDPPVKSVLIDDDREIKFTYKKSGDQQAVPVIGRCGSEELYRYLVYGDLDSERELTAVNIPHYTAPSESKTVLFGTTEQILFEYVSDQRTVTIEMVDEAGKKITGVLDLTYQVMKDTPFTVYAPVIPGWVLIEEQDAEYPEEVISQDRTYTFVYEKAEGTLIVRAVSASGDVLRMISLNLPDGSQQIAASSLGSITGWKLADADEKTVTIPNIQEIDFVYEEAYAEIKITAVNEILAELVQIGPLEIQIGTQYTAIAPVVPGYSLADGESGAKTIYVDGNQEIQFAYTESQTNIRILHQDESGQILSILDDTAQVGSYYTAHAMDFKGYELMSPTAEVRIVSADPEENVFQFSYEKSMVDIRVNLVDIKKATGENLITSYTEPAQLLVPYIVVAPSLPGYVLEGQRLIPIIPVQLGSNEATFTYIKIEDMVEDGLVSVPVTGKTTEGVELYHYTETRKKSEGDFTITAFPVNGYEILGDSSVDISAEAPLPAVEFQYRSSEVAVTIRMVDEDGSILNQFYVKAITGQPFHYMAPAYPGCYLQDPDAFMGKLPVVSADNTENVLTFVYQKAVNELLIAAKEQGTGKLLGYFKAENPVIGSGTYHVEDLLLPYYTAVEAGVSYQYDGTETVIADAYFIRVLVDIDIEATAGGAVLDWEPKKMERVPLGDVVSVHAPNVTTEGYTLTGDSVKVAAAEADTTVTFTYRSLLPNEIQVRAVSDQGALLQSYVIDGVTGEMVTVTAPAILGWSYQSYQAADPKTEIAPDKVELTFGPQGKTITFRYDADVVQVKIIPTDRGGVPLAGEAIIEEVPRNASYTAYAPHVAGYVLAEEETGRKDCGAVQDHMDVTFAYDSISSVVPDHTVTVTVRGLAGETVLYSYRVYVPKNSGAYKAAAFPLSGYQLDGSTEQTISVGTKDETITFQYYSLATTVTIHAEDLTGGQIADSFHAAAEADASFTYNAPDVAGYMLAEGQSSIGIVNDVQLDGSSEITFKYGAIPEGQIILYAKEAEGDRIIRAAAIERERLTDPSNTYSTRDLLGSTHDEIEADCYILIDDTVVIQPDADQASVRYQKNMVAININAEDTIQNPLQAKPEFVQGMREGEAAVISAPNVETPGYTLSDSSTKTIIAADGTSVTFQYRYAGEDEIIIKAVSEADELLFTYPAAGVKGSKLTMTAPNLLGWQADAGNEKGSGVFGTDKEILFVYSDIRAVIKIQLLDADQNELTVPQYQTERRVAKGTSYTIYAPHVSGYQLKSGEAQSVHLDPVEDDRTVTFTYEAIENLLPDYSVKLTVTGQYYDGFKQVQLYQKSTIHPKNFGDYLVKAETRSGYVLIDEQEKIVQIKEADIEVVFQYEAVDKMADVKIVQTVDGVDVVTSTVSAVIGEPFTYLAPYLEEGTKRYSCLGYTTDENSSLNTSVIGTLSKVKAEGSFIQFEYEELDHGELYIAATELRSAADGSVEKHIIRIIPITADMYVTGRARPETEAIHLLEEDSGINSDEPPVEPEEDSETDSDERPAQSEKGGEESDKTEPKAVLDERSANGLRARASGEDARQIRVPDLSGSYYTVEDDFVEISDGETFVEAYYTKDMQAVTLLLVDQQNKEIQKQHADFRKGELASVTAPRISGYIHSSGDAWQKNVLAMPGAEVIFQYQPLGGEPQLKLFVTDASSSKAIQGATVTVTNGETTNTYITDEHGAVNISSGLDYGKYTIKAAAPGYTTSGTINAEISTSTPQPTVYISLTTPTPTSPSGGGGGGGRVEAQKSTLTVRGMDQKEKEIYSNDTEEVVGNVITVTAPSIEGHVLAEGEARQVKITIAKSKSENIVTFHYVVGEEEVVPALLQLERVAHIVYLNGDTEGTVRPEDSVTRAEVATMFYQLVTAEDKKNIINSKFSDISAGAWYEQAVCYLEYHGILMGYPDGTFKPDNPISRAEFAAIASRFDILAEGSNNFPDVSSSHWAAVFINHCSAKGWIVGYPDGTFKPEAQISRAETVTIINHMLNRRVQKDNIPGDALKFTDLNSSHWAYEAIIEASVSHTYERNESGTEIWIFK